MPCSYDYSLLFEAAASEAAMQDQVEVAASQMGEIAR